MIDDVRVYNRALTPGGDPDRHGHAARLVAGVARAQLRRTPPLEERNDEVGRQSGRGRTLRAHASWGFDDVRVGVRSGTPVLALLLCLSVAACGGDDLGAAAEPDPPVGSPVLPDLMPKPQNNVLTQKVGKRWRIRFNTIIVNVGAGGLPASRPRTTGRSTPAARWRARSAAVAKKLVLSDADCGEKKDGPRQEVVVGDR